MKDIQLREWLCPLVERKIDELTCEDVAFVAEGISPARFAPKEFRAIKNFEEICNDCKNHPD